MGRQTGDNSAFQLMTYTHTKNPLGGGNTVLLHFALYFGVSKVYGPGPAAQPSPAFLISTLLTLLLARQTEQFLNIIIVPGTGLKKNMSWPARFLHSHFTHFKILGSVQIKVIMREKAGADIHTFIHRYKTTAHSNPEHGIFIDGHHQIKESLADQAYVHENK